MGTYDLHEHENLSQFCGDVLMGDDTDIASGCGRDALSGLVHQPVQHR
jgi:hypothetical protein